VVDTTNGVIDTTEASAGVGRTSIQVSEDLADELYDRKGRGDSYEDVIWTLIERADDTAHHDDDEPDTANAEASDDDVIADVVTQRADLWTGKYPESERKLALMQVLERVRDEGTVAVAELKAMEAQYPVEGQSAEGWWNETIVKGLKEVAEYDSSERGWSWTGGE